jgi:hypothetical protein
MQPAHLKLKQIADLHANNYAASLALEPGTLDGRQMFLDGFFAGLRFVGVKVDLPTQHQTIVPVSAMAQKMSEWTFPMETPPADWSAPSAPTDSTAQRPS